MRTYRGKPTILAGQFTDNESAAEILEMAEGAILAGINPNTGIAERLYVKTPAGEEVIQKGWWVIKDHEGNFWTCEPEIFERRFEELSPQNSEEALDALRRKLR
jgi:hypothetical protein